MRIILIVLLLIGAAVSSHAQFKLTGLVKDKSTGTVLPGTAVIIDSIKTGTTADEDGIYVIDNLQASEYKLRFRLIGYKESVILLNLFSDTSIQVFLESSPFIQNEIIITATRAGDKSGMAVSTLSKTDLSKSNSTRDIPYLLESVPSLVSTSDGGNGIGYTGIRIRGSDASRINVTIDGIPINDSESQLLYWVNMPDLISSVENIEVQRGVGTSTNGSSAFGGSINILSAKPSLVPYASVSAAAGSFNSLKSNVILGTGLINGKWNFDGRLSKITSDGYIDRASSDLKSFFVSGRYYGEKDLFKINVFSGKEETYQSWYGVPKASLDTNRTWNYYTYDNQVDNYQQDHYQVFYSREINKTMNFNSAFHFTKGSGYFEEFREGELLSDYLLEDIILGNDTISATDLIRRKWLDNDFYGTTFSLNYSPAPGRSFILGGGWNEYKGNHFGEVIWARYFSNGNIRHRYYDDDATKNDFNIFLKTTYELSEHFSFFGDMQLRNLKYKFTARNISNDILPQSETLLFWNPKAGITYTVKPGTYGYVSFSVGNKEPSRDDYTQSTVASRPGPERLYDLESGYKHKTKNFMVGINYYMMLYDNQLVLTGKVNDVGNFTRSNIKNSSRKGIELEAAYQPIEKLTLKGNMTFSKNKIEAFREYIDDYDSGTQLVLVYKNTDIAFSPNITAFGEISFLPFKKLELSLINKYTGKQFLDNTSNSSKAIDPYNTVDFRTTFKINPKIFKEAELSVYLNNIFDEKYESNGYTFSYIYGGEKITENYYYPQAGFNFMFQLKLNF